ncbi:molybdenum cofactor biosynthesis protein MoaE, partial [Acinetobacter baumannii]
DGTSHYVEGCCIRKDAPHDHKHHHHAGHEHSH